MPSWENDNASDNVIEEVVKHLLLMTKKYNTNGADVREHTSAISKKVFQSFSSALPQQNEESTRNLDVDLKNRYLES